MQLAMKQSEKLPQPVAATHIARYRPVSQLMKGAHVCCVQRRHQTGYDNRPTCKLHRPLGTSSVASHQAPGMHQCSDPISSAALPSGSGRTFFFENVQILQPQALMSGQSDH